MKEILYGTSSIILIVVGHRDARQKKVSRLLTEAGGEGLESIVARRMIGGGGGVEEEKKGEKLADHDENSVVVESQGEGERAADHGIGRIAARRTMLLQVGASDKGKSNIDDAGIQQK